MIERAVFFCGSIEKDPVAAQVLKQSRALFPLEETGQFVDGQPVLAGERRHVGIFHYVTTAEVISDDLGRYLPNLNGLFADFFVAGLVNWHAGNNAPEKLLCAHTTGHVPSSQFGSAAVAAMSSLLRAMEEFRQGLGLNNFKTSFEATHWSGVQHEQDPRLLLEYALSLMDNDISSNATSYGDPPATEVLARALPRIFDDRGPFKSMLCVGGMHFEPAFSVPVLNASDPLLAASHVLPDQWLEGYAAEGTQNRRRNCVNTIAGGNDAVVFHDSLKGSLKAHVCLLAEALGVRAIKHERLRQPIAIEWPAHDAKQ